MTVFPLLRPVLLILALGMSVEAASAEESGAFEPIVLAQAGCSAAAQQAAAQTGGQVLSVQTAQRGGQTVCIVTVLIPARDGDRPRRTTITIPQ